jgi:hypothetical protein
MYPPVQILYDNKKQKKVSLLAFYEKYNFQGPEKSVGLSSTFASSRQVP